LIAAWTSPLCTTEGNALSSDAEISNFDKVSLLFFLSYLSSRLASYSSLLLSAYLLAAICAYVTRAASTVAVFDASSAL